MSTSIFAGMSRVQLQEALASAQQAYIDLQAGKQGVSFAYTQGDGTRSVTYQTTSIAQITSLIRQLQTELGLMSRARRPLRFRY